ncbi:MAG TPA: hypothetical protein G4N94_09210 [Caldilineae bacterium]|nr:hypothetical protein [Caldilineae bacterium]
MHAFKSFIKVILRLLVVWFIDTLSLFLTAEIVGGITITSVGGTSMFAVASAAALVLGIVNLLIRPIVLMLAIPLGFAVVFIVGFFVNAITLMITGSLIQGFTVEGFWAAILGGLFLGLINTVITTIITVDDDDSFYQGVVERLAGHSKYEEEDFSKPGLLMMEIDGLSYWHLKHAIEKGLLPTFKRLMESQGYALSHVDCGLPSQTSACQAGIMFGDNYDIPAFRWYDKDKQKLYVSGSDASEINARYARGQGLMRGGASINNMMNGDAKHSLLTLADLKARDEGQRAERARDISLLVLNPYFLIRVIILFLWEALVEVWQYRKDVAKDVQPRLNRLHGGYPFIRAATTVFMRDISGYLTGLEVIRGAPSIYVTWPGYDEVAHHSGPWSSYAFDVLSHYDKVIASMLDLIERKAPRPYNLVVLSDHGQSFGFTFKQRYDMDLQEYIESLLPKHVNVHATLGGDEGSMSLTAVAAELDNVQKHGERGAVGQKVIGGAKNFIEDTAKPVAETEIIAKDVNVTMCGSGNIAQVYFDLAPHKLALDELQAAYPGLVDEMVQHEGVGVIVSYNSEGQPIAMGKAGMRNLHTDEIIGEDPMAMFGDPDLRAAQMRRIADFPHAGDLIVNSSVFPDGTVAAMEELIGNHGGMGGEQTDAFLFHPANLEVTPTTNSTDVYHILNSYREEAPEAVSFSGQKSDEPAAVDAWSFSTLVKGFAFDRGWVGKALRALVLDTGTYREVADDPYMTGPALLMLILGVIFGGFTTLGVYSWTQMIGEVFSALLLVFFVFLTARVLGGTGSFTRTLRTVGFAYVTRFYSVLAFLPAVGDAAKLITLMISIVAVWIAGVQAHRLQGWRSILFPIIVIVVFLLSLAMVNILLEGAAFTIQSLIGG